ncbi:MAG: phosphonate C-P lyase system protein PhnH [Oscillospiraceae bacterium]|jgi:alpha-D-ribose 1-methylphosphonate 5-triphosphate synthase subunit PhnH
MKKIHTFDEVHDSQRTFRLILEAMSNPLKIVNIKKYADKLFGSEKSFLAVAMTLLDNEVSFFTFDNEELDGNIISLTLSEKTTCENADFIFAGKEEAMLEAVRTAKCGTHIDPHKSATVISRIKSGGNYPLKMSGPGIDGCITLNTDKTVDAAICQRDKMCFEYPQGIDMLFIDDDDKLFAVPRLVKREG